MFNLSGIQLEKVAVGIQEGPVWVMWHSGSEVYDFKVMNMKTWNKNMKAAHSLN